MNIGLLTVALFGSLFVCLVTGFPIAFGLGGVAMLYALTIWGPQSLLLGAYGFYDAMWNFLLIAIPLFILMGNVLARSGVSNRLFDTLFLWLGPIRGGLAITLILVGAVMGAMVGIIGASIATLGVVAIPAMTARRYDKKIMFGSLMSGGALASLIPPSCAMIVYSSITEVSVGKMFMGGVIPGLILAGLYITYIGIRSNLKPELAPALAVEERVSFKQKVIALKSVVLPASVIISVIGSIFFGVATPTEASSVGVAGAVICAAANRRLNWQVIKESTYSTVKLLGMIVWILIGANIFSRFYIAMGAVTLIETMVVELHLSPWWILIVMQLILIVMGMVMEDWAIIMIAGPIFSPIAVALGFDPLWFSILFMINLEIAVLTPPFGFCLFYAKALAPEEDMGLFWRAIIPFVPLQIVGLGLCMGFPQLILWLPTLMFQM